MWRTPAALIGVLTLATAGCGNDDSPPEEDQAACDAYEDVVADAEAGADDQDLLDGVEAAWLLAETDRLDDLLDDMLIVLEGEGGDLDEVVGEIRSHCGLD